MFSFFGLPPLAPNRPLPRAIFDSICDVLCTSSALQKRAVFLPRGGRRHFARPLIAKAKATPHAMRSNMPGIRCLVHRRILTGYRLSAADPETMLHSKRCNRRRSVAELCMVVGCLLGNTMFFVCLGFVGVGGVLSYTQFVYWKMLCYFFSFTFSELVGAEDTQTNLW